MRPALLPWRAPLVPVIDLMALSVWLYRTGRAELHDGHDARPAAAVAATVPLDSQYGSEAALSKRHTRTLERRLSRAVQSRDQYKFERDQWKAEVTRHLERIRRGSASEKAATEVSALLPEIHRAREGAEWELAEFLSGARQALLWDNDPVQYGQPSRVVEHFQPIRELPR